MEFFVAAADMCIDGRVANLESFGNFIFFPTPQPERKEFRALCPTTTSLESGPPVSFTAIRESSLSLRPFRKWMCCVLLGKQSSYTSSIEEYHGHSQWTLSPAG